MQWLTLAGETWAFARALLAILLIATLTACSGFSTKIPEPGHQIVQIVRQERIGDVEQDYTK